MRLTSPRGLARRGAFAFSRARVSRLILGALSIVGALWAVGCGGGGSDSSPITPLPPLAVSLPSPPISPLAVEGNGSANNPILLGNIYQLQFIGGTLSAEAARQITVDFQNQLQDQLQSIGDRLSAEARRQLTEDFRFDAQAAQSVAISDFGPLTMRMTLHYKLTADLDLSAAAKWNEGKGFAPIGSHSDPFSGIFNGDGYVLRGLRIRRVDDSDDGGVGLFAYLGGGARVVSLGIADARVEGRENVGALAGEVLATVDAGLEDARLEDVWAWGRVFGSGGAQGDNTGVGGLVGRLAGGQIARGWFGGYIEDGNNTGGLVGFAETNDGQRIEDSWAMAAVSGNNMVGGLLGGAIGNSTVIYQSWAAGPVYPMPLSNTGLVGGLVGVDIGAYSTDSFSGIETSGQMLAGDGGTAIDSILTLSIAAWNPTVWNFGGDSNFPVLRAGDSDLQKVAMAYGLTRLSVGSGDLLSVFPIGVTMTINGDNEAIFALDVNGQAANLGDATPNTPIPDCRFFNDRMEAVTNYNGAKVRMWMVAANTVNAVLRAYSGGDECYARVIGSGEGILRVDFAVGAQRMTLDYPFEIEDGVTVNPPFGVSTVSLPSPPISPLAVEGNGTANNPILLGNIYQLQFIGGTLSSVAVEQIEDDFQDQLQFQLQSIGDRLSAEARRQLTEDFSFDAVAAQSVAMSDFGPLTMRMTLHYKLTADLDLSAAAGWDDGKGFAPIGVPISATISNPFSGIFNGDGYVLRGLRIRRGDDDPVGFFAYLGDGARVVSLGIADARVEGRMTVGALAGDVAENARLEDVWAWGRVFGATSVTVDSILETTMTVGFGGMVGGLVGHLAGGIERGWFGGHARAENGDSAGGLVGFAEISGRIEDSWAMAAVRGESMVGGLLGGAMEGLTVTVIDSSWAAGPVFSTVSMYGGLAGLSTDYSENSFSGRETSGRSQAGGGGIAVDSILTLIADWDSDVWSFGGTLDFPILRAVDFPVLRAGDSDLQETAMAYGLTRLSVGAGDFWPVFPIGGTMMIRNDNEAIFALDVNGQAANLGDATPNTPIPDCRFFNDRMEAVTNYNGAKVRMWMVADNAVLRAYSGGDECYTRVIGSGGGVLRVDFAVGAQRMTLDYPFQIEGSVNPPFGVSFPSGVSSFEVIENEEVEIGLVGLLATFTFDQPDSPDGFNVIVRDGGAFVTLTSALISIFDTDEREVALTLRAMDALSPQPTTLVAVLVSPPRAFDGGNSEVRVTSPVAGTVVLSATDDVRISLWHLFGRSTMFSLAYNANAGDLLFGVDSESGQVSLARPPRDDENNLAYSLTLRGRPNDNGVLGDQVGEQTIRVLLGNPLLEVIGDGSEESPYIIDDIYELQAIDGVLPDEAVTEVASRLSMTTPEVRRLTTNLFSRAPRSGANYRLGADIDATPTRGWGVLGFKPIDNFTGVLDGCVTSACDGGVYVVRGLYINRTGGNNIGLFSQITKSGELAVHDLGVEEANINGGGNVGIIAGKTENVEFRKVWTSGRVDGEGNNVGGLIGSLEGGWQIHC